MLYFNFIHEYRWGLQNFAKLFISLLFTSRMCVRRLLKESLRKNIFFHIWFRSRWLCWVLKQGLLSNKPTLELLDYYNFFHNDGLTNGFFKGIRTDNVARPKPITNCELVGLYFGLGSRSLISSLIRQYSLFTYLFNQK